ncbi:hypothetical protein A3F37_01045 [Candidatus Saccharibacteria bacterium RIFCSPHIGHO2_12_FULL_41_12]|nr:MAG: hypothetical protein A3F37_01045 [Candidatus Saccharibacteria bacterium RIFCSPHIGHO2_12_FULL_41_12]
MSWQFFIAISVITSSVAVLLQRLLLHRDKSNPYAYIVVFEGLVALFVGTYAVINGFVMPDFGKYWLAIIATCVLYGAGNVAYAKTLQRVEASIFSVLFATGAVWVMLMGIIFLDEVLSTSQIIGSVLIFISIAVLGYSKKSLKFSKGILFGLLTGLIYGVATALWAYVGRGSDVASWTAISFAGPSLVVLLAYPSSAPHIKSFLSGTKLIRMVLLGLFFSVASVSLLTAYNRGDVSAVAPINQTAIVITTLLAVIFLRERDHLPKKILSATICFIGALLIAF